MKKPAPTTPRLGMEQLESRELCAVDTNLTSGVLTITGTTGDDVVTVDQNSRSITVRSPLLKTFKVADVSTIVFEGGYGNDSITLGNDVTVKSFLYGGAGNDYLAGGANVDAIFGGKGDDELVGNDGLDTLRGSHGRDTLRNDGVDILRQNNVVGARVASAFELEVIRLVNVERTSRNLASLAADQTLGLAAFTHSRNQAKLNVLAHYLPGSITPSVETRLSYAGFEQWSTWGEAIGSGYSTPAAVVDGWMNSPPHRAILLGEAYTRIGIGTAVSSGGTRYWTLNVAAGQA